MVPAGRRGRQKEQRNIMTKPNRSTQQDRYRKAIAAIQKYLSTVASMLIAGVSYTPTTFIALLQKEILLEDAASKARNDLRTAAAAARQNRATMVPIMVGFRAFLENMFTDPSTIAEFGFAPRKRTAPTVEAKTAAVNKRAATRAARHTMGPKQKLDIKGAVAQTEPAAPSPAPVPTGLVGGGPAPVASAPPTGSTSAGSVSPKT
jgi:hypothetical protein